MTTATARTAPRPTPRLKRIATAAAVVLVVLAMVLSTKFVPRGSALDQTTKAFSASAFGKAQFPKVQGFVNSKAVDAATLAAAIQADPAAAGKKYGVPAEGGVGVIIPVSFTATVGEVANTGYTPVTVQGLTGPGVAVQFGPPINGTDLRDSTGKYRLGSFENQIQYQDAASALNNELKKVLAKAGAPNLGGKTVQIEGVFNLVNPAQWNVTPATLKVQG